MNDTIIVKQSDIWNRCQPTCCPYTIEKWPLVEYSFVAVTDVLYIFFMEKYELDFSGCSAEWSREPVGLQMISSGNIVVL